MTPKFVQPAFIKRNSPELRKKLEELGYYKHPSCLVDKTSKQFLFCNRGMFAELLIGYTEEVDDAIDCGDNEQLFLALAALREDSDKFQWFCDDEEEEYKSLFFCKYDDVKLHIHNENGRLGLRWISQSHR